MQTTKANTASMQVFREGRDFIEAQNWQKAAEKFNDFIKAYPKDKDLDAALYWYGYALQKQGRKEEAAVPLLRLINGFQTRTGVATRQALLVVLERKADVEQALDRDNCEIKILALQSLFQADQDRAIGIVTDALQSQPNAVPGFSGRGSLDARFAWRSRVVPILLDIARSNPRSETASDCDQAFG